MNTCWQLGQTYKLTHSSLVTAQLTLWNSQKVDRKTTYCQKCGEDGSRRLHGSSVFSQCNIKESAHTLAHMHAHFPLHLRSLAPLTTLPFPLSFSPFSLCHAAHAHGKKRLNKYDTGTVELEVGTVTLKSLLPLVLFTSVSCLIPSYCRTLIGWET